MYLKLLLKGRRMHGIQGDPHQLGGDVIVGADRRVHLVHNSHNPANRPSIPDLLDTMRDLDST